MYVLPGGPDGRPSIPRDPGMKEVTMRFRSSLIALVATAAAWWGGDRRCRVGSSRPESRSHRFADGHRHTRSRRRRPRGRVTTPATPCAVRRRRGGWTVSATAYPLPGSTVEVVGTPLDDTTIAVESLRVTEASATDTSPLAPVQTKVLVIASTGGPTGRPTRPRRRRSNASSPTARRGSARSPTVVTRSPAR